MQKSVVSAWWKATPPIFELYRGELPDLSACPAVIQRESGEKEERTFTYSDITGVKPYKKGKQTALVDAAGAALTCEVLYRQEKLTALSLKQMGKTKFHDGDLVDVDGFMCEAVYSDGTVKEVLPQCREKSVQLGDTVITLTYGCRTIEVPIRVLAGQPTVPQGVTPSDGKAYSETAYDAKSETAATRKADIHPLEDIEEAAKAKIVAISVAVAPTKYKYLLGAATADLTNGMLDVMYDDGSVYRIPMNSDMQAAPDSPEPGERKMIVRAFGKTAQFPITVLREEAVKVSVRRNPDKLEYEEGDPLVLDGLVLSVLYNDDEVREVSGLSADYRLKRGDETVSLNYMGVPFSVPVVVKKKGKGVYPVSLELASLPSKINYLQNEKSFDPAGGELMLQYSNGHRDPLPFSEAEISGFDTSCPGDVELVARVSGFAYRFNIHVSARELDSLTIEGEPKTEYYSGEPYILAGLVVFANYNNGEREAITRYGVDKTYAELGDTEITFVYDGKEVRLPVTVREKRAIDLTVEHPPVKTSYMEGDVEVSCDGGRLRVAYEDGSNETVVLERSHIASFDFSRQGITRVIIRFLGLVAHFDVCVEPARVVGLEVTSMPRVLYTEGEEFDAEGLVVVSVYSNNTKKPLRREDYFIEVDSPLTGRSSHVLITLGAIASVIPITVRPRAGELRGESLRESAGAAENEAENVHRRAFYPFYPSTIGLRFG